MRLLDLRRCDLEHGKLVLIDTKGKRPPPYAILSHRWEAGEVLFADVERGNMQGKHGYSKVQGAIRQTLQDGFEYLWIDTCCIDKSSSAELSEAINSMYQWYYKAQICYAYLSDVTSHPAGYTPAEFDRSTGYTKEYSPFEQEFCASQWFTRGWTLQELLAPTNVDFHIRDWSPVGSKLSLQQMISDTTGISTAILAGTERVSDMTIARRMSWASRRRTTRIEDTAYCLMGIFSVNMPLLYGEGNRAFIRLQEEIIKASDDYTIFAWKTSSRFRETFGLFAEDPTDFRDSGDILPYEWNSEPFAMTNKGLRITLESTESQSRESQSRESQYRAILPCAPAGDSCKLLAMHVGKVNGSANQYVRVNLTALDPCTIRGSPRLMYFPQRMNGTKKLPIPLHTFSLKIVHESTGLAQAPALAIDACFVRDYPARSTRSSDFDDNNGANETTNVDLVESLRGHKWPNQLCLPTWDTGLWIVILFERELAKPSKSKAHFVLLLGTSENGDLGHCIQPLTLQGTGIWKERRSRYLFKPAVAGQLYILRAYDPPWCPREFAGQFSPVPLGNPSTAWLDFHAAGSSVTVRSSRNVVCSELVTVVLEEKPEECRKEHAFPPEIFDGVLEIRISVARLSSAWRSSGNVHAKEGLAASERSWRVRSEDPRK